MESFVIPSAPNWYAPDVMACAPDNTLMYGSKNDLVIIKPTENDKPNDIEIIPNAHYKTITIVSFNKNWGSPNKYAVTGSADKVIKLWDVETLQRKMSHNKHGSDDLVNLIGLAFAGDNRVVSATSDGQVIVWNLLNNEQTVLDSSAFKNVKGTMTCLSICPHESSRAAFGYRNGLVIIVDLRRSGKVLATFRGHKSEVISMSWCPVPVNVFPKNPNNTVGQKKEEDAVNKSEIIESSPNLNGTFATPSSTVEASYEETLENKSFPSDQCFDSKTQEALQEESCDRIDAELKTPTEKTTSTDFSENVAKVITDSEIESDIDTPTDRRVISMELSTPMQRETLILLKDLKTDGVSDTPPNQLNDSMEISHSVENTPDSVQPETKPETEDRQNQSEDNTSRSTSQQGRSEKCTANEEKVANGASTPSENWRTEACQALPKLEEEPRREFLLATSARDGYVYIWQTLGGPLATFFTIPQLKNKSKNNKPGPRDVFSVLCWATPHMLLSNSATGDLVGWTIPKPVGHVAFKKIHYYHGRQITSIKVPTAYWNETNFLESKSITVWTAGLDRVLCSFDCSSKKKNTYYQSLNGSSCYFAGCPVAPSLLAIGDEKNIKLCNLDRINSKTFNFPTSFDKIHSVITAMVWHPTDENSVAWGTQEGRIGILTISGCKLKTRTLPQYFKSEILKLEWGPEISANKRNLFAISEGTVVSFSTEGDQEPVPLKLPQKEETKMVITSLYTFAWSPDYSFFFGSSKSGNCIIFEKDLRRFEVCYIQPRVDSVVWHPNAYASQNGENASDYSRMFASVVMATGVKIFTYKKTECNQRVFTPLIHIQNRNKVRITAIQWSPFSVDNLVWVDETGVAVVVNTKSGQFLHTYINPWLRSLVAVYWSPIDPNYIILATDNRIILSVKITDYSDLRGEEIDAALNQIKRKRGAESTHNLPKLKEDKKAKEGGKNKNKKYPLVPVFYTIKEKNVVSDLQKLLDWKLNGSVSQSSDADENFDCFKIGVLDVFANDCKLEKIFKLNVSSFMQNEHFTKIHMMSLLQGNISETIRNAIEEKRVDRWILSVAPMVSPQVWREACAAYVEQLLEQSEPDIFEVVTYQLACHQVEEAVKFLCERDLFREAYVLAKCRFGFGHEMVSSILNQWAKHCSYEGNFELAACCYLTLGMYNDAAILLYRRTNVELLGFAVVLATLAENDDLQMAIKDKIEALKNPVDLTKPLPYLDHKGEKLRIFSTKTPSGSDSSDGLEGDNELPAESKQEVENTDAVIEQSQSTLRQQEVQEAQTFEKADNTETVVTEERHNIGSDYEEPLVSAVDDPPKGDKVEEQKDALLESGNLEVASAKASSSDVAEAESNLQVPENSEKDSKLVNGHNLAKAE